MLQHHVPVSLVDCEIFDTPSQKNHQYGNDRHDQTELSDLKCHLLQLHSQNTLGILTHLLLVEEMSDLGGLTLKRSLEFDSHKTVLISGDSSQGKTLLIVKLELGLGFDLLLNFRELKLVAIVKLSTRLTVHNHRSHTLQRNVLRSGLDVFLDHTTLRVLTHSDDKKVSVTLGALGTCFVSVCSSWRWNKFE